MVSRIRNRAGRFVWRLTIIVAATAAVGLLLVVAVVVLHPQVHFVPGGAFAGSDPPTFAATVGSTVSDSTGQQLDGTEDSLLTYRGRVVLIDFWATWCKPCVDALPALRELVAELPADRFTLLAISVDGDRETVTRFMEDEPMPWANWHAGLGGDSIARAWGIRAFPTYVLVNDQGLILARTNGLTRSLVSTLRETVEAASQTNRMRAPLISSEGTQELKGGQPGSTPSVSRTYSTRLTRAPPTRRRTACVHRTPQRVLRPKARRPCRPDPTLGRFRPRPSWRHRGVMRSGGIPRRRAVAGSRARTPAPCRG